MSSRCSRFQRKLKCLLREMLCVCWRGRVHSGLLNPPRTPSMNIAHGSLFRFMVRVYSAVSKPLHLDEKIIVHFLQPDVCQFFVVPMLSDEFRRTEGLQMPFPLHLGSLISCSKMKLGMISCVRKSLSGVWERQDFEPWKISRTYSRYA